MPRILDQHRHAGALHEEIQLLRFVNETVFQTKSWSFGMALEVSGLDPECRLEVDLDNYSRRLERALKTLDERFRLYQYVIKRFDASIPRRTREQDSTAGFAERRVASLARRSKNLAAISIHFVILYEGNKQTNWFGFSAPRALKELNHNNRSAIEILTGAVRSFVSSLDDMLGFDLLDERRATLFFRRLLNPDQIHAEQFHFEPGQRLDYVIPDTSIRPERDHLLIGDHYCTAASIKLTPTNPLPAVIAMGLQQRTSCDFIACMEWKPQSANRMRSVIKSRKKTFAAQSVSVIMAALAGAWTPKSEMPRKEDVEHHAEALGDCLVAIERGFQFGTFSCVIVLLGEDRERVRNSFAELVRVYGQSDASLINESLNLLSAYLSIIPGNTQRNHSYSYLLDRDYANLCFAWQSYTGNPFNKHLNDEYLCLYETHDQQLFFFNGHVGGTFGILKTGAPESGKSFDTVYQIANLQKYDPITLILDIGHGYRDATEYFSGEYYEISKRAQPTRMNPFSLPDTYENCQFLFHFLRLLLGKDEALSPEEAAKEDEAIHEAIEGIYTLEPQYRRLKYVSLPAHMQKRLKRWREGGQYGHIFDNEHDTIRFTHLQTFEFQGMEKDTDVLVPLCFYITQRFDQIVYDQDQAARLKVLIIDEAWRWMLHGDMGPYMIDKLKTGRKNNLCNMFITQSGLDADRAGFGELLNEACPMKVFFANSEIQPETYERLYNLNPLQARRVAQLKPREELAIFATDPERPAVKQFKVVRLRIDDAEDRLLCSNDPHANQIKQSRRRAATA